MNKLQTTPKDLSTLPAYLDFLTEIKEKVSFSQHKAMLLVNSELIRLYWEIGKLISVKQTTEGWGSRIIPNLAKDLQSHFPGIRGFSRTNLFRIRAFYQTYQIVPQTVGQFENSPFFRIPWGHNILLIEKLNTLEQRTWYAESTLSQGWSREALKDAITSNLFSRQGKAITNFSSNLSLPQSELATEVLKDPYNFDFLSLRPGFKEKELEQGLVDHVEKFLLELGQGFAYLGRQYPLTIDQETYYLDLLFYHVKLQCYVVIELKSTSFDPRDIGQMNFYLSAVDDKLRNGHDNPSIGLLLCKDKKGVKVEYALRDFTKPIGVAEYVTNIVSKLPSVDEIESELNK